MLRIVALRKESVDRNSRPWPRTATRRASLSARRAWIEIVAPGRHDGLAGRSLSARRAWIEIP